MKKKIHRNTAWVIVKSVKVRDGEEKDSPVVATLDFGQVVNVIAAPKNGRVHITCHKIGKWERGGTKYHHGWIPEAALTQTEVVDYAKLFFRNKTGRKVPVTTGYQKTNVIGYIEPREKVAMIARAGEWCLTNKGWTKFQWFRKCVGEFDDENIADLANNIILQAAKDYSLAIEKIRKGFINKESFLEQIGRVDEITSWFCSPRSDYCLFFEAGTGAEKLDALNKHLRVDKKWLDDKHRILKELQEKGRRYRR